MDSLYKKQMQYNLPTYCKYSIAGLQVNTNNHKNFAKGVNILIHSTGKIHLLPQL